MRYVAVILVLVACARPIPTGAPSTPEGTLTGAQLIQSGATNTYDAIQKLRPQCLRTRASGGVAVGRTSADPGDIPGIGQSGAQARELSIYIDGSRSGIAQDLRAISVEEVLTVECLSATDAAQRFGLNNSGGAIVITRRRG